MPFCLLLNSSHLFRPQTPSLSSHHHHHPQKLKMQMYFLLAAVFPTVILGSPVVAEGPIPTVEDLMSFLPPQDLASNPDQITYSDAALQLQNINDQTSEPDFAALPDQQQQTGPNFAFDVALAAPHNRQEEKVDDDTAKYREFNCQQRNSVCCQGSDLSRNSNHKSCSESKMKSQNPPPPCYSTLVAKIIRVTPENENQYAGHEDVDSKDLRYGQYCYNPFYTAGCDDSLVTMLQVRGKKQERHFFFFSIPSFLSSIPLFFS